MEIPILLDADKASIKLPHHFDRLTQTDFRQAYTSVMADLAIKIIEVDFTAVEYIDSSALGSLLLLRQHAEKSARTITIIECQPAVMKTLTVANFHRIFDIH